MTKSEKFRKKLAAEKRRQKRWCTRHPGTVLEGIFDPRYDTSLELASEFIFRTTGHRLPAWS